MNRYVCSYFLNPRALYEFLRSVNESNVKIHLRTEASCKRDQVVLACKVTGHISAPSCSFSQGACIVVRALVSLPQRSAQ